MKTGLMTIAALMAAAPAMAHVDSQFHTHGIESTLVLALVAAGVALMVWRR
ncbi:MAG: hypothetical protein VX444_05410 [Pseudomonadota bacterium]|nr:hypothetical protein [Pseudomonadota bacterium]